jgi:hypothetical protein
MRMHLRRSALCIGIVVCGSEAILALIIYAVAFNAFHFRFQQPYGMMRDSNLSIARNMHTYKAASLLVITPLFAPLAGNEQHTFIQFFLLLEHK